MRTRVASGCSLLASLAALAACSTGATPSPDATGDAPADRAVLADNTSTDVPPTAMDASTSDANGIDALGPDARPMMDVVGRDATDAARDVARDTMVGDAGTPRSRLTPRYRGYMGATQGYYEYLPPSYSETGDTSPLLIAFHGIDENGDGSMGQLEQLRMAGGSIPTLIYNNRWPLDRPFVVLAPQHPGGGCPSATEIRDFAAWAIPRYHIDTRRVYMTGLSCGAIGLWNYLAAHRDDVVAAAVPVAGDGRSAWNSARCELGRVPLWAFHGDADPTVNVAGTTTPVNNLRMMCTPPPPNLEMTIYPTVTHNSWGRTYDGTAGHDIYSWFLRFTHP